MFKVKGQDGGIYEIEKIYPKQYVTYAKTHYFIMGNDDIILGIFESQKTCNRILKNFLIWYNSSSMETSLFTIAQDDTKTSMINKQDITNTSLEDDSE